MHGDIYFLYEGAKMSNPLPGNGLFSDVDKRKARHESGGAEFAVWL
jgi:hypothetical protein